MRSACTAAAGLDATQRMSASVPQKFRRCRRSSPRRCLDDRSAVVEHSVEELLPRTGELVGQLLGLAAREEVALLPLGDVGTATLDEVVATAARAGGSLLVAGASASRSKSRSSRPSSR